MGEESLCMGSNTDLRALRNTGDSVQISQQGRDRISFWIIEYKSDHRMEGRLKGRVIGPGCRGCPGDTEGRD